MMDGMAAERFRCWCCGQPTLQEEPVGSYEICPNCGWEDDLVQLQDPDYAGGANGSSLRDARRSFLEDAALDAYWRAGNLHGRPRVTVRIPDWPPVTLHEGAGWFGSRIENGWFVGYRVCASGEDVLIWMKFWEYGESEPPFPAGACPDPE
jgi:Cysteine-rich CPCC